MGNLKTISVPKKPNKELIELLGAHWGDGCLQNEIKRNNYVWRIFGNLNKDENYLDYLSKKIFLLFSIKPKKHFTYKKNMVYLEIYSKSLLLYLKNNLNITVGKKRFLEVNKEYIENSGYRVDFIRGLFDTDWCVVIDKRKKKPYGVIKICNSDYSLITYIVNNLKSLGFNPRLWKGNKWDDYQISICGREEISRWIKVIGSNNPRNKDKLNTLIQ
mgnify:FL=1